MLILGHLGVTGIIVKTYEKIIPNKSNGDNKYIDYRVVMLGALLPDIIDKPIVEIMYGLKTHSGHWFAHSLIFSHLLILVGIAFLVIKKNKNFLLFGICSLLHQFMDIMILKPNIFIYPFFGKILFIVPKNLGFVDKVMEPIYRRIPYFRDVKDYFLEPYIYIFELIGGLFMVYYIWEMIKKKRIKLFFKKGTL